MSYFPDYRHEDNFKHLKPEDREFLIGYSKGLEMSKEILLNACEEFEIDNEDFFEEFGTLADCDDIEMTCAVFDNADYIPENIELIDVNKLFENISHSDLI